MTCPHCQAGYVPEGARRCPLCGQLPSGRLPAISVAEPPTEDYGAVDELVRAELGAQFRIDRALKHGRASHVYFARDAMKGGPRETALKVMMLPAGTEAAARIATELDHPNIARPYRHGATDTLWWYAMEYVPAPSIAERLATGMRRPLDVPLTWRIALQVAGALDYAHRRGIVHGRLNSADVLLDDAGWVHVVDTGMLPSEGVSPLDDQYNLALLVRECLTGTVAAGTALPPAVGLHAGRALERALASNPHHRFAGVLEFVVALTGSEPQPVGLAPRSPPRGARNPVLLFDTELPTPRSRRLYRLGLGLVATVAGGVLWLGAQSQPTDDVVLGRPPGGGDPRPATSSPDPAPVAPAPVPTPPRAPAARVSRPAPPRRVLPAQPGPGFLSVNTKPWALLSIDGRAIGTTPRLRVRLQPGLHHLRLQRAGFKPYEAAVEIKEAETVVITNITLTAVIP